MMKKTILFLFLSMQILSSLATETLPRDVRNYVDKREGCDHMRGEIPDPSDKQRMREVNREIRKLCKGTDENLAQLKKKYAKNQYVMRRLDEFDPGIEEASPRQRPAGLHAKKATKRISLYTSIRALAPTPFDLPKLPKFWAESGQKC